MVSLHAEFPRSSLLSAWLQSIVFCTEIKLQVGKSEKISSGWGKKNLRIHQSTSSCTVIGSWWILLLPNSGMKESIGVWPLSSVGTGSCLLCLNQLWWERFIGRKYIHGSFQLSEFTLTAKRFLANSLESSHHISSLRSAALGSLGF